MKNLSIQLLIISFVTSISLNLNAQVEKYTEGIVYLRSGDSVYGKIKLNTFSTHFVFKDLETKKKRKLGARDVDYILMNDKGRSRISFKIINGKGGEPKIVQQITRGRINLFKKLERGNPAGGLHNTSGQGHHNTNQPQWSNNRVTTTESIVKANQFTNTNDILLRTTSKPVTGMAGAQGAAGLITLIMLLEGETWLYSEGESDLLKPMPSKRNEIMKLFNDCPQAMVQFRDVENKDFDFIYFLNYYNVNCPGN